MIGRQAPGTEFEAFKGRKARWESTKSTSKRMRLGVPVGSRRRPETSRPGGKAIKQGKELSVSSIQELKIPKLQKNQLRQKT